MFASSKICSIFGKMFVIFRDVLGFVAAISFFKVRAAHLSLELVSRSG